MSKKKNELTVRSSAAEYLTYVASTGDNPQNIEIRYEDENIWLTQKIMAQLYEVTVPNINYHINKIFKDSELQKDSVIKKLLITADDGKPYNTNVSAEIAKLHAESEFEKYRIIQDQLYMSDYDKYMLELENAVRKDE